jgi:hypothetical protein
LGHSEYKTGITCLIRHAFGAGRRNIAQSFGNEGSIPHLRPQGKLQDKQPFRGAKVLGDIMASSDGFGHDTLLQVVCKAQGEKQERLFPIPI